MPKMNQSPLFQQCQHFQFYNEWEFLFCQRDKYRLRRSALIGIGMFLCWLMAAANVAKSEITTSCWSKFTSAGTAIQTSGSNLIVLDDGSEIVLAGILMPTALDVSVETDVWQPEQEATQTLAQLVLGQTLRFAPTTKWRDRYGRRQAHAFLSSGDRSLWLQLKLIQLGQARVAVENLPHSCAEKLLKQEELARNRRLGLWRYSAYAVRSADRPWHLLRYRGSYQIVEGVVVNVTQLRSRAFINFGPNKSKDFTAGLFGRFAHDARINGKPLTILKGKRVRTRGWISWRGGPFIRIRKISQILPVPSHSVSFSMR